MAQAGEVIGVCPSVTVQVTVTLPVYQPFWPSVPVTMRVMTGGVVSRCHTTACVSPPSVVLNATIWAPALIATPKLSSPPSVPMSSRPAGVQ